MVSQAERLILAPIGIHIDVDSDFIRFIKDRLLGASTREKSIINVSLLNQVVRFLVVRTMPRYSEVIINKKTSVEILRNPFESKQEQKYDIDYLLRYEWLNHLKSRINANKILFSIEGTEFQEESEENIIQKAKQISEESLLHSNILVNFYQNNVLLGTLQWLSVDIFGFVTSNRPNMDLPPPLSPITIEQSDKSDFSQIRRCFKTGTAKCPKEINFNPKQIVIAISFAEEYQDLYKYAIRPALDEVKLIAWKADENISNIDIMCKVCHAIQESSGLIADITNWNANVLFDLGLAYGIGKNSILIKKEKADVPVDLKGIEYISYKSIDDLKRNLSIYLKGLNF
jgi:hypothetical protein